MGKQSTQLKAPVLILNPDGKGGLIGLTYRRKTTKNLVDSRKNGKILTVNRK